MKRLFFDIETSFNICGIWETSKKVWVSEHTVLPGGEWKIVCAAWKLQDEDTVHSCAWNKKQDDKKVLIAIRDALLECDEAVAHFGDSFDLPKIRTRCYWQGIPFPADIPSLDTGRKLYRKFKMSSRKLDYITSRKGLARKIKTDFDLWVKVRWNNDRTALAEMVRYCEQDVVALQALYESLVPYISANHHAGRLDNGTRAACPQCGKQNMRLRKQRVTAAGTLRWQYQCNWCLSYFTVPNNVNKLIYLNTVGKQS